METEWFVNAKRALAIAQSVCSQADALVDTARESLECAFAIHSKSLFLTKEIQSQMALLYHTNQAIHSSTAEYEKDFKDSLAELDRSGARLDSSLSRLETSIVDPGFRTVSSEIAASVLKKSAAVATKDLQSLKDYIDDSVVEELKEQLRQAIDFFRVSHDRIVEDTSLFNAELSELSSNVAQSVRPTSDLTVYRQLTDSLESIGEYGFSMGQLLESLTLHYDKCSQALMTSSTSDLEDPDRNDLVEVLRDDASQVDGVVDELRQRLVDIEVSSDSIKSFLVEASNGYKLTSKLCGDIGQYQEQLEGHLLAAQKFSSSVSNYFDRRNSLLDELNSLVSYYEQFMHSYDALVLEVIRRKNAQKTMEKVARDALAKLEAIYEEEVTSRKLFRQRNGDYLPSDLWPGLSDPPIGYEIIAHEVSPLPDLNRTLIDEVKKRLMAPSGHLK
ncbi:autophagy-related protein 17 [Lipomyces arxii]|uniref:autophagy-related protein 17 n=1 Tax=Lipomyces arxii TaxID=56418 RepID=UPI0034CE1122